VLLLALVLLSILQLVAAEVVVGIDLVLILDMVVVPEDIELMLWGKLPEVHQHRQKQRFQYHLVLIP
jgi:hypothetical protein